MANFIRVFCIIAIYISGFSLLHAQTDTKIKRIINYCDSLDKVRDTQTIFKAGAGVTLEYVTSNESLIKIIEHPFGYKFISATETYYFENNLPVYVSAEIEISSDEGDRLTIELQKIYFENNRILQQQVSQQIFNPDSLYKDNTDPLKTAGDLRKNARFRPKQVDPGFEKILLQAIESYLNVKSKKEDDPAFNELYSPFI